MRLSTKDNRNSNDYEVTVIDTKLYPLCCHRELHSCSNHHPGIIALGCDSRTCTRCGGSTMRSSTKDNRKNNDFDVTVIYTKSTHCAAIASCTRAPITIQASLSMEVVEALVQEAEAAE